MSGLDMAAYNSEEDPFFSAQHQPDEGADDTNMPDGWEHVGTNAKHREMLATIESVSSTQTSSDHSAFLAQEDWVMVPHELDLIIINRKKTREAQKAIQPDPSPAIDSKVRSTPKLKIGGSVHPALLQSLATIALSKAPAHASTVWEKGVSQLYNEESSDLPSAQGSATTPGNTSSEKEWPHLPPKKPKPAQVAPKKDRHFCLLIPTDSRTSTAARKSNPSAQGSQSLDEKDLPFLPSSSHKEKDNKKKSSRQEHPQIIQRLRAMAEAEQESPAIAATVATREAGRRAEERLANAERVPSEWYGVLHGHSSGHW